MNYRLSLVTAPAAAILTAAEVKAHLRVDGTDEDTMIASLISVATAHLDGVKGVLGRALISQTWRLHFDTVPSGTKVSLPIPTVQSIDSVAYVDPDGASQTLAASNYRLFAAGDTAAIELTSTGAWPSIDARSGALSIDYVTGYGDAGSDVPAPIKQAALLMIGGMFENREPDTAVRLYSVPRAVEALYSPYRVVQALY